MASSSLYLNYRQQNVTQTLSLIVISKESTEKIAGSMKASKDHPKGLMALFVFINFIVIFGHYYCKQDVKQTAF